MITFRSFVAVPYPSLHTVQVANGTVPTVVSFKHISFPLLHDFTRTVVVFDLYKRTGASMVQLKTTAR